MLLTVRITVLTFKFATNLCEDAQAMLTSQLGPVPVWPHDHAQDGGGYVKV